MGICVSILVPVYNVEKYIERCARSLFEQTYKDIEYVFVNDCSTDNSIAILKKLLEEFPVRKPFVRIISHSENRGLAAARNTAVDCCQTEFLIHVDSDDWIEKNAVEKLVDEQVCDDYDIVTGNAWAIKSDGNKVLRTNELKTKQELICEYIKPTINHVLWGRLIRTSLYKTNNIYASEGCNIGEDHQVVPRLFYYANNVSAICDCIYYYNCINENSYMRQTQDPTAYSRKIISDIYSFDVLNCFFYRCPERLYYETVNKELALYIYMVSTELVKNKQKDTFNIAWARFFQIKKKYRQNLPGFSGSLSLALKSNYQISRLKCYFTTSWTTRRCSPTGF